MYYKAPQNTTPILHYYKVLLQNDKVLLQYYSILQSTTPCHEKWHLTFTNYCACYKKWHVTFTKCCAWQEKWNILDLYQVLRLPRKVTRGLHQLLHLPRKMTLEVTKYWVCHTKWLTCLILVTYVTLFTMRGATNVTIQTHQILPLPRKMTTQNLAEICGKQLKLHLQCAADPRMIRNRSENDPRPFPWVRNSPRNRDYFLHSGRGFCIEKYNISRSGYLSKFHQVLRLLRKMTLDLHQVLLLPHKVILDLHQIQHLPRKVIRDLHQVLRLPQKISLEFHQIVRLPRRMTRMLDACHICNIIYNARNNICHHPNSPNIAPATQNYAPTSGRNLRKTAETLLPMRGRSENDPRPFREWSETVPVGPQPAAQQRLLFALRTRILYPKIQHFALRLSFQISPSTAPATKSDTWPSPSIAPATKNNIGLSPNIIPAI